MVHFSRNLVATANPLPPRSFPSPLPDPSLLPSPRCLLSAFFSPRPFPACLFSFVRGSDISLPPRILLRRRASCFQPRAFVSCPCPVNVLSVSSQPLLNLLSVSSQPPHIVSLLECIASTHTSSLGVLSAHRRIAVARVGHCMPSSFFPLSVYISPGIILDMSVEFWRCGPKCFELGHDF